MAYFENGKNRYESIADIDEAIDFIMYYSDEMQRNRGFVTRRFGKFKRAEYKHDETIWCVGVLLRLLIFQQQF
jgi:delta 1-pyrroline-5-carboxylate dehydrogenase